MRVTESDCPSGVGLAEEWPRSRSEAVERTRRPSLATATRPIRSTDWRQRDGLQIRRRNLETAYQLNGNTGGGVVPTQAETGGSRHPVATLPGPRPCSRGTRL